MPSILNTFVVTVRIHATCTLQIPAEDCEEALRLAYNSAILDKRLYEIEKDVVRVVRMSANSDKPKFTEEECHL
jgi:hypothetical protein